MEDLAVLANCEFIGRLFFVLRNGFPSDLLICIVHEERSNGIRVAYVDILS